MTGPSFGERSSTVFVVIPALNEEEAIGRVLADIPDDLVSGVIVVDNGSRDRTAKRAVEGGAQVVREPRAGYGQACLTGIEAARQQGATLIVFLDGDYSDYPADMGSLVQPILRDQADFVVGSRMTGQREPGSLLPQQLAGNWLAGALLRAIWGAEFTDMGPFRAITVEALDRLGMRETAYGWTIEMQVKAAEAGLRCREVPVRYRKRIGVSKVTGTVRGTLGASTRILWLIGYFALSRGRRIYAAPGTSS